MAKIFKAIVVTMNILLLVLFIIASSPMILSGKSSIVTPLMVCSPFAITIFYILLNRKFMAWLVSLLANLLIIISVMIFIVFVANITGSHSGSFGLSIIKVLFFVCFIGFVNTVYLFLNKPKKLDNTKYSEQSINMT
jgi:hypothetical protein